MIISLKDCLKLIAVSIVCVCAVFVCTFFLNFYLDVVSLRGEVTDPAMLTLYDSQLGMAQATVGITGGCLGALAVILLVFYIKLHIDANLRLLGVLKAMGWSNAKIALKFWVFGLSVFVGCALGFGSAFIAMPTIYNGLVVEPLKDIVTINFHAVLLVCLVVAPTVIFTAISCGYAYLALKKPVADMLRGVASRKQKAYKVKKLSDRDFLKDMAFSTLKAKKSLAFFVAFACFCFSAMVQMSISMKDLSNDGAMWVLILVIGLVLACLTIVLAVTSLISGNKKTVSIMKAFGYSLKECVFSVLSGYAIFAVIGFVVGTLYQFGLLSLMMGLFFKEIEYGFDVPALFITLAAFIGFCGIVFGWYTYKINKISVKEVMLEI